MIDKISVMVADIDGTLTMKGGQMMPHTKAAIQRLHDEGVLFGIASGRPLDYRIQSKAKEWGLDFDFDFMIGMNGGDLWTKGMDEIQHFNLLPTSTMKEIMGFLKDVDMNAISYIRGYDEIWSTRMDDFMKDSIARNHSHVEVVDFDKFCSVPTGKIEVHYPLEKEEETLKLIEEHKSENFSYVRTFIGTVEFQVPGLNKGLALTEYCKQQNIDINEVIAFGDMDNDLGLLKEAGYGVCMQNGCDACKEIADAVTEYSVYEDGVGRYLEDHYF